MADEATSEVVKAPSTGSASAKVADVGANGGKAVLSGDAKTATGGLTPAPVTGGGGSGGSNGVRLMGEHGEDLGVTVDTLGRAGQDADVAEVAKTITGWSTLVVDGQPFEYSAANALALVQRFPHFAEQLRG